MRWWLWCQNKVSVPPPPPHKHVMPCLSMKDSYRLYFYEFKNIYVFVMFKRKKTKQYQGFDIILLDNVTKCFDCKINLNVYFLTSSVNFVSSTIVSAYFMLLTHWGRVTHICVSDLTINGPDNGLSPGWRQANIWTNAGILLIGPLGTNFSEILIEILTSSFKKMRLKVSSAKRWPFCLSLNVLSKLWS